MESLSIFLDPVRIDGARLVLEAKSPLIKGAVHAGKCLTLSETSLRCSCGEQIVCITINMGDAEDLRFEYAHMCMKPGCDVIETSQDCEPSDICSLCRAAAEIDVIEQVLQDAALNDF